MKKNVNKLILRNDDYEFLAGYIKTWQNKRSNDSKNLEDLQSELKKAILVNKEDFPADVIRLNSTVKIKESSKDRVMELTIVKPGEANIKEKKVSIIAPIGTALIGFRKGNSVQWQVPGGKKTFIIMHVENNIEKPGA